MFASTWFVVLIDWVRDRTNKVYNLSADWEHSHLNNRNMEMWSIDNNGNNSFILSIYKIYAIHPEFLRNQVLEIEHSQLPWFSKDTAIISNIIFFRSLFCVVELGNYLEFICVRSFFSRSILNMKLAPIINFDLSCKVKKCGMRSEEREREICGRNQ